MKTELVAMPSNSVMYKDEIEEPVLTEEERKMPGTVWHAVWHGLTYDDDLIIDIESPIAREEYESRGLLQK